MKTLSAILEYSLFIIGAVSGAVTLIIGNLLVFIAVVLMVISWFK